MPVYGLVCWGLFSIAPRGATADNSQSVPKEPRPAAEQPDEYLIGQANRLGNPSFSVRERATRNLIEAGIASRPALNRLLDDSDAEVRARARQILNIVREADFRLRLKAFESDTTGKLQHDLPSWDRFRREVGETREARELFVAMQRAEAGLLETLAKNPKEVGSLLAERCQAAQATMYNQTHFQDESGLPIGITGTVSALLFVASANDVQVDEQDAFFIDSVLRFPSFTEELRPSGLQSANCRRLLGHWIAKNSTPNLAMQNLTLAFNFDLKEGGDLARRMLSGNEGPVESKPFALLAISRFGTADDVPMLERFFKDERICVRQHNGVSKAVQIQVRDVALAAALHLTNQEPKAYGLNRVASNPQMVYLPNTILFADQAARDAAFKKWTDWQANKEELTK